MNVHTYADGFGTWHAVVTGHRSEMDAARAARAAIRRELTERGAWIDAQPLYSTDRVHSEA